MKYNFELDIEHENSVSLILKQVKKDSKVLEFGSAMGRMTKYLKNALNCEVYIVEIDKEGYDNSLQYANDGYCGDAEDFVWVDQFAKIKFDYIIFADFLEHLKRPELLLQQVIELLNEDGQILISIPNIAHNSILIDLYHNKFNYSSIGLLDNTHLRFFTYFSLLEMLDNCGLIVKNELATYAQPEETEFLNHYTDIPLEYANLLKMKEFGTVYQFIFTCIKKEYYNIERDKLDITKNINRYIPVDYIKLYFDDGTGLNENNIIKKPINMGRNTVTFCIENLKIEDKIRIDFTEERCAVKIINLIIDDVQFNMAELPGNYSYHYGEFYVFYNNDPYVFILNLLKVKNIIIEFEIDKIDKNLVLADLIEILNSKIVDTENYINNMRMIIAQYELENAELKKELDLSICNNEDTNSKLLETEEMKLLITNKCSKLEKKVKYFKKKTRIVNYNNYVMRKMK